MDGEAGISGGISGGLPRLRRAQTILERPICRQCDRGCWPRIGVTVAGRRRLPLVQSLSPLMKTRNENGKTASAAAEKVNQRNLLQYSSTILAYFIDVLYWRTVLRRTILAYYIGVLYWRTILRRTILAYYIASYYIGVLYWRTILAYYIGVLYWRTILAYYTGVLYWRTILAYYTGVLYWRTLLAYYTGVLYWRTILAPVPLRVFHKLNVADLRRHSGFEQRAPQAITVRGVSRITNAGVVAVELAHRAP